MRKPWTDEEFSTMRELKKRGFTWQQIADVLNRNVNSVKQYGRSHGLADTGCHKPYTEDQDKWILDNWESYPNYDTMAKDFNAIFGTNKTSRGIQSHCVRYLGIVSGRQGIKKCTRPHNRKSIGSEYVNNANGYTYVKISDDPDRNKAWIGKHRFIWLNEHGEIPKGYNVIFLDGDKSNLSPENLECVSDRENLKLTQNGWHFPNKEMTKTAVQVIKIEELIHGGAK